MTGHDCIGNNCRHGMLLFYSATLVFLNVITYAFVIIIIISIIVIISISQS